ncbi:uncharacterized protein LOC126829409 isoform X2 [Patella vulgata]|uniref:uncharacterized protein LOC126829409 isoform X2 n=1 Tax=Patella vulgata TaxID=6465 RepID=UPI0021808F00|nr:uncharacterized protein LOC126829409 isoform X2 [Patella vulgata]
MASLVYVLIFVIICKFTQCKVELTGFDFAYEGEKYVLTCHIDTTERNYETKYNWYRNNELVARTDSSPEELNCKIFNISQRSRYELNCKQHQLIIKSVDQTKDSGVQWSCKHLGYDTDRFPDYTSTFVVKTGISVPVKNVSISFKSTIYRLTNDTIQIKNGEVLRIRCEPSKGASPAPNIRLYKNDVDIQRTTGYYLETNLTVTMEMDESQLYCKANNSKQNESSTIIKLQVLDSTTMSLHVNNVTDNEIILQCEVDGQPNNYTFSPWKHFLDGVLIREVNGYLENGDTSIYYLNISTQLYKNRGVYVCSGNYSRNGQMYNHTTNMTICSTASIEFYVTDTETMNETVRVGSDYNISKIFITGRNSNITWFKGNNGLERSSRIGIRRLEVNIPHDYNQSVLIPYSRTLITITHVQVSDEGWYQCFICNHDDCSNSSFHLLVEDEDPVKDTDKETVQGDPPQREMEIMENDLYISGDTPTPQQNNVEVVYTPVNKITQRRDASSKPEMEIMENDLYISADYDTSQNQNGGNGVEAKPEMEIMENDLYISADYDTSQNQTDGNGVKTKPEMEIMENDLYISADYDTSKNQNGGNQGMKKPIKKACTKLTK